MANVLEKIVADKRNEMVAKEAELPLASFIDDLTPSSKSFYNALAQDNAGYILECKKASPSKGLIRPTFDFGRNSGCVLRSRVLLVSVDR